LLKNCGTQNRLSGNNKLLIVREEGLDLIKSGTDKGDDLLCGLLKGEKDVRLRGGRSSEEMVSKSIERKKKTSGKNTDHLQWGHAN